MEVLLVVFAALAALGTFAMMRPSRANRLRQANTAPISAVVDHQEIKVQGVVICDQPLRAPYTGRECVYFRLEITQGQSHQRIDAFIEDQCDF